jgi:membrane-associated phospholipid phosphatase
MKFADDYYLFYNPVFQKTENMILVREKDRHDGKEYFVPRFSTIELVFQDTLGSVKAVKLEGVAAYWVCQAMDTIDGLFAHDYGLEIIPEFQDFSKPLHFFWVYITLFGTRSLIDIIYIIFFLFIPLNKVYSLMFILILTAFADHILKLIYLEERPIWLNVEIKTRNISVCGYGNPSGHALTSVCLYLSFWYILCQIFDTRIKNAKIKNILKYLILVLFIFLCLFIMVSRFYLGVHSLNQIIFGGSLGLGLFLLFLPALQIYRSSGSEFLNNKYTKRYRHLLLISLSLIIFYALFFGRTDIEGVEQKPNWVRMCYNQDKTKVLINSSFIGGMHMFIILGMNIGLYFTKVLIDREFNSLEEIIINWHKGAFSCRLIRLIFLLFGFSPLGILFKLYYSLDISIILIHILTPILFFIGGFLAFGPCLFYGYKFTKSKFKENEIYSFEQDDDINITGVDYSNEILNN